MRCYRCKKDKPQTNFTKYEILKEGSKCCKECRKELNQSESKREYYRKNKEEIIRKYKEYYEKNKEVILEKQRQYHYKYWDTIQQKNKVRNKLPQTIKKRKERWRYRYDTDIKFRLKEVISKSFIRFFEDKGENKYLSFSKIVDYTYEELKNHLESYFRKGMSWDNYGELWEIHHIKPQNLFDITKPKEVRECWKLDNLIPLWKTTEISHKMGDTIIGNRNLSKTEIYSPYIDK